MSLLLLFRPSTGAPDLPVTALRATAREQSRASAKEAARASAREHSRGTVRER